MKKLQVRRIIPEIRYIFLLFFSTRLALTLIGVTSRRVLETGYGKQFSWSKYSWLDIWGVWDSYWYLDIAQNGYSTVGSIPGNPGQTNFPFFPLYPLLMKLLGQLTGGEYFFAGIFISNVCLLVSGYLLYKLIEPDTDRKTARLAVKYLLLYPVSFILSGVFTESLYLCLMLLCFYLAKRRRWMLAGAAGMLLSATRTLGVLILLPLLFEYLQSVDFKPEKIRRNCAFLLLIPLGLLSFCLYSYQVTGDFLFFKTSQAAWGRSLQNPAVVLWNALVQVNADVSTKTLLETGFCVAALLLLNVFYPKIGFAYWLLGMYSIVIPLTAGMASMARFTLPVFPLFMILAKLGRQHPAWDDALTLFLGCLQGGLMVYWCMGQSLVV